MESLESLLNYLQKIEFPATKAKLIDQARTIHAPNEIINGIERLPDQEYNSVQDLWQAISKYK